MRSAAAVRVAGSADGGGSNFVRSISAILFFIYAKTPRQRKLRVSQSRVPKERDGIPVDWRPLGCKLRPSVAAYPIIEQVIDSNLHHLNIRVAGGESVAGEEPSGWSSKCLAVQPEIIILDLHRPIGHERPFDAPANQPAAVGVVVGAGDRCARHRIGDGEAVVAQPTAAGLAIKQPDVIRDAEPGRQGRDPPVVRSQQNRSKRWANNSGARTVGVRNPVEVPFNTENQIAELIVESELASSDECALVVSVAEPQAEETIGHITLVPSSTQIDADVESSPT